MSNSLVSDVRIWRLPGNTPVGVGFIVSPTHVITCAHVVADALGNRQLAYEQCKPEWEVQLDFPALATKTERRMCSATIRGWSPVNGPAPDDIAILELREPIPKGVEPISICDQYTPGDIVRAFGVRVSIPDGAYVEGKYLGLVAGPRLQISSENKDTALNGGCSGGAVWLANGNGVIGMVTAAMLEASGLLLPIEEIAKFYEAKTGLDLLPHAPDWDVDNLISAMFEEQLAPQDCLKIVRTFPMGPAFDAFYVPISIKRAYAARLQAIVLSQGIIGEANKLLLESLPKKPKNVSPYTLAVYDLPNPDQGWLHYWSTVFSNACVLSPRLVAALLVVAPPTVLCDVKEDTLVLIKKLRCLQ